MSQHPLLKEIESAFRRTDIPDFRSGDSVRVHTLIKEGDKERVQVFEGVVIGQHRGGSRASFTVRKVSYGVGVERIFPMHTSRIERIEIVQKGHVRRARLNYLRQLQGRAARIKTEKTALDIAASPGRRRRCALLPRRCRCPAAAAAAPQLVSAAPGSGPGSRQDDGPLGATGRAARHRPPRRGAGCRRARAPGLADHRAQLAAARRRARSDRRRPRPLRLRRGPFAHRHRTGGSAGVDHAAQARAGDPRGAAVPRQRDGRRRPATASTSWA